FFFFQAEDGIRDFHVTGVQTCALPISPGVFKGYLFDDRGTAAILGSDGWLASGDIVEIRGGDEIAVVDRKKAIIITAGGKNIARSEERRVGKERRTRGGA